MIGIQVGVWPENIAKESLNSLGLTSKSLSFLAKTDRLPEHLSISMHALVLYNLLFLKLLNWLDIHLHRMLYSSEQEGMANLETFQFARNILRNEQCNEYKEVRSDKTTRAYIPVRQ